MLATLISRIFDPFIMLAVVCILLFWSSPNLISALALTIGLPFLLFVAAWRFRIISNWDVTDRKERPKLLWSMLLLEVLASVLLGTSVLIPFIALFIGFAIITHFWKISGHMMAVALAAGMIIQRFGWGAWPVIICVPIVLWARVAGKYHTVAQAIAGTIYPWIFLLIFDYWIA